MDNIAIIGVGGFGREVKFLLDEINKINKKFNILGFYDDADELESSYNGLPYLGKIEKLNLLISSNDTEFALIFKFEKKEERENLKQYLISKAIFPMVLWPNQLNITDKEIEQTLLFLHIDFRYSTEDVTYIVNQINQYFLHAI